MNQATIITGDCREVLQTLESESVQCVITSPPYWGLRDYGTAQWEGGDSECLHRKSELRRGVNLAQSAASTRCGGKKIAEVGWLQYSHECPECGAVRIDRQLGLEESPAEYIAQMVAIFREVRRVLRPDGTLWLNMGDNYAGSGVNDGTVNPGLSKAAQRGEPARRPTTRTSFRRDRAEVVAGRTAKITGLKAKDLVGMPWRLALALQDDGWWLRSDIIWHKPNPMPESVRDRPTKAHEYIFLLTKSARYYYDFEGTQEPVAGNAHPRGDGVNPKAKYKTPDGWDTSKGEGSHGSYHHNGREKGKVKQNESFSGAVNELVTARNMRSVWSIATAPFPGAHFATFPPKLIEPCVKAGTSEKGQCPECGAPWVRQTSVTYANPGNRSTNGPRSIARKHLEYGTAGYDQRLERRSMTTGWEPQCAHDVDVEPQVILDPFAGAGTTGLVATRMDRRFIGIELNPEYAGMARQRIVGDAPLLMADKVG